MSTVLSAASLPTAQPPVRPGTVVHASAGGGGSVFSIEFATLFRSTPHRSDPLERSLDPSPLHGWAETVGDSLQPDAAADPAHPGTHEDGRPVPASPSDPSPLHDGSPVSEGAFASQPSHDHRLGGDAASRATELRVDSPLSAQGRSGTGISGTGISGTAEPLRGASPDLAADLRLPQAMQHAAGKTEIDGPVGDADPLVALSVRASLDPGAAVSAQIRERLQPPLTATGDGSATRPDRLLLFGAPASPMAEMAGDALPASSSPAGDGLLQRAVPALEGTSATVILNALSDRTVASPSLVPAGMQVSAVAAASATLWGESTHAAAPSSGLTLSTAAGTLLVEQTTSAGPQTPAMHGAASQAQPASALELRATAGTDPASAGYPPIPMDAARITLPQMAGPHVSPTDPAQTLPGAAGAPMPLGPDGSDRLTLAENPPSLILGAGQMTSSAMATGSPAATAQLAAQTATQIASALSIPRVAEGVDLVLSPPELGRVAIRFDAERAGGALVLLVDRPETLDLMRRHLDTLDQALRHAGHEGCSVALGGRGGDRYPPASPATPDPAGNTSGENTPGRREDAFERSASVSGRLDLRL